MVRTCTDIVENHPEFTLKQIKEDLELTMPWKPSVSLSTVSAMLHGQLITVKKLESPETNRNSPVVKEARRDYAVWLNSLQARLNDPEVVFPLYPQ